MTDVAQNAGRSASPLRVVERSDRADTMPSTRPTLQRIVEFAALPENWDSYGAVPVTARAVATACALIEEVADGSLGRFGSRAAPWTSAPIADGGIQLEWLGGQARIEVQAAPDGTLGYLIERGVGDSADYEEGEDISRTRAVELVLSTFDS